MNIRLAGLLLFICFESFAQRPTYSPRAVYGTDAKNYIHQITAQLDQEFASLNKTILDGKINETRKKYINSLWKRNLIIEDDSLQGYVSEVVMRLVIANSLETSPRYILLIKDSEVNAQCLGKGIFLINIGLLSRISSEEELAFTLAHEIAHDELAHVRQSMLKEIEEDFSRQLKKEAKDIFVKKNEVDDIEDLHNLLYPYLTLKRKNELQADSLAVVFLQKASYSDASSLSLLDVLKDRQTPKYNAGLEMFLPLHSDEFPFQDHWLNERTAVIEEDERSDTAIFMLNFDSLRSHPEIEHRKKILKNYLSLKNYPLDASRKKYVNELIRVAEFETIESSYVLEYTEKCILDALMLMTKSPNNSYLISRIGAVLLEFYEYRNDNPSIRYRGFAQKISPQHRLVRDFLWNISTQELGDLVYYFLKNEKNFDPRDRSHYYLKWRICDLTYRYEEKKMVADEFKKAFGVSIGSFQMRAPEKKSIIIDIINYGK